MTLNHIVLLTIVENSYFSSSSDNFKHQSDSLTTHLRIIIRQWPCLSWSYLLVDEQCVSPTIRVEYKILYNSTIVLQNAARTVLRV
jgi:hypothetical protein